MKNLDKLIKLAKLYEQSKQYNLADETINKIKITLAQQTYKTNAGLTVTKPTSQTTQQPQSTPQQTNKQLNYGKDASGKDVAYDNLGNIYQLDAQGNPIIPYFQTPAEQQQQLLQQQQQQTNNQTNTRPVNIDNVNNFGNRLLPDLTEVGKPWNYGPKNQDQNVMDDLRQDLLTEYDNALSRKLGNVDDNDVSGWYETIAEHNNYFIARNRTYSNTYYNELDKDQRQQFDTDRALTNKQYLLMRQKLVNQNNAAQKRKK
jgi:hypothetical protein